MDFAIMVKENTKNCNGKLRKNLYPVLVNALVVKDGKILIAQRGLEEKHGPGKWCIPGGRLEHTGVVYEALQKTAKREVLEETGVEVEDKMYLVANNTFQHDEDELQMIVVVFLCFYKFGELKAMEDTIDVRWIRPEEIDNFDFHNINVKNYVLKGFEFLHIFKKNDGQI